MIVIGSTGEEGAPQEISDNNWIWLGRPTSLDAECGSGERKRPSPSSRQPFKAPKSKSENVKFCLKKKKKKKKTLNSVFSCATLCADVNI